MIEYIGYWSDGKNGFPLPQSNAVENNEEAIKMLDKILENATALSFRGFSKCRCCNKNNGNKEYSIVANNKTYIIPEGYRHYLVEHKIKPSPLIAEIYNTLNLKNEITINIEENRRFNHRPKIK